MKQPRHQTLSVTLATFNEEANLAKCLKAVKGVADEIIIVDGSSTDKTVAIARKYRAKVIVTSNKANFHINKQMANDQATKDWVLQLDADEFVTKELQNEITDLLAGRSFGYSSWQSPLKRRLHSLIPNLYPLPSKLSQPATAYFLPRKNFFLGRYLTHAGQYPDPVIRLFRNKQAYLPAKDVHEQMVVKGEVGWLEADLDHFATPQFSRYLTRENRYSSFYAAQLYQQQVKINFSTGIYFLILKPLQTFFSLYFRYRGFLDGFPGFVFSLFSSLHFQLSYMKLWEIYKNK